MKIELAAAAENVRSAFNVGAFFRLADGLGISQLFLCGNSPFPPHDGICKTALGAEKTVPWKFFLSAEKLVKKLRAENWQIVALENSPKARNLREFEIQNSKICLFLGNEIDGVSPKILQNCDEVLKIEMRGAKESLNVSTAAAIAFWELSEKAREKV